MQETSPLQFFLEMSGQADQRGEYRRADRALVCARLVVSAQHVIDTQGAEDAVVRAVFSIMQSVGSTVMPRLTRASQALQAATKAYVEQRNVIRQQVAEEMQGQGYEPREISQKQALTLARSPEMDILRQRRDEAEQELEMIAETSGILKMALYQASRAASEALAQTKLFPQPIRVVFEYLGTTSAFFDKDAQELHINISQLADADAFRQTVRHELIHALEYKLSGGRAFRSVDQQDLGEYLNQPHEVRSFAADIAHELLPPRPEQVADFSSFLAYVSQSPTFKWVIPHMQGETRTLLFKVLYSILVGIAPDVSYSPQRRVPTQMLLESEHSESAAEQESSPAVQQPAGAAATRAF